MIGAATMGAVMPAPAVAADAAPSTPPATAESTQAPNSAPANQASAKPAKAASQDKPSTKAQSSGDDASDFDRLLAPGANPATATAEPPATDASTKPAASTDAATVTPAAAPSLADQLLGQLGLLGTPVPATPAPAPQGTDAPAPASTAATTTVAAPMLPTLALAQTASGPSLPTAAAAADASHAMQGAAVAAEFIVAHAARDGSTPVGNDAITLAARDPVALAAPAPLPISLDRLPSVPQPAVVQPPTANAGYGDDLGSSVMWMAEHRVGHAALQVSPDHLGPIEVRLQIDGARVHAEFFSAQPEVRHALEASLPRLRDMLGQHGLQLGQADVGQRQRDQTPHSPTGNGGQSDCFPDESRPLPATLRRARGLVDEYA